MATRALPLALHQEFSDFRSCLEAFENWQAPYLLLPIKTNERKAILTRKCAHPTCSFHFHASFSKRSQAIRVSSLTPDHTCIGITVPPPGPKRKAISSKTAFIARHLPDKVTDLSATTRPSSVRRAFDKSGIRVPYHSARRALSLNFSATFEDQQRLYKKFPGYLNRLAEIDPDGHFRLKRTRSPEVGLASRIICTYHLANNVLSKYKKAAYDKFKKLVDILSLRTFEAEFEKFQQDFPEAANYLENDVGFHLWAFPHLPFHAQRYGHSTSNIVESINASLEEARHLPCLRLLDIIWLKYMNSRSQARKTTIDRYGRDGEGQIGKVAVEQLGLAMKDAAGRVYEVYERLEEVEAFVIDDKQEGFTVHIDNCVCQCGFFQNHGVPCAHAIAFLNEDHRRNAQGCIPYCLKVDALRDLYDVPNIAPIGISVLDLEDDVLGIQCLAPNLKRARGRPRTCRVRRFRFRVSARRRREILAQLDRLNLPNQDFGIQVGDRAGLRRLPRRLQRGAFPVIPARFLADIQIRERRWPCCSRCGQEGHYAPGCRERPIIL
ncbi:hypothetical protein BJ508DRAFT_311795 [Ascobolus immersus RN42]|uniref:SWIM-type domain-containing protein n=1 Tax=Ascobolus immersus RN42 TaxID=1160509 RepID=A0A3N4HRI8_ASCIM|nr:hypothetical protein BJ508DRAFT_311795 [Ascobolus immersus RN42]